MRVLASGSFMRPADPIEKRSCGREAAFQERDNPEIQPEQLVRYWARAVRLNEFER
jgi:hypothetical protein